MSQNDLGPLLANETSGAQLAALMRNWRDALHSMHSGPSRPTYAAAGTMWLDNSEALWSIKIWTGSVDVLIGRINPTTGEMSLLQAPEPGVLMRVSAGAGPMSPVGLLEARAALSDLPLLQKFDASDLSGLAQILYNIPDEYAGLEIRFAGLRTAAANGSLFLLRWATAPNGTPASGASEYTNSTMQLRGNVTDAVTNTANSFVITDLSNTQNINQGVIRVSIEGYWKANAYLSGTTSGGSDYISMRHSRSAGNGGRRLQLGFNGALAASGWIRLYGIR